MQITGILFIFIGMTLTLKKSKDKKLSQKKSELKAMLVYLNNNEIYCV